MIYVVSGYRRSGTSAMMRALRAGGLRYIYNDEFDDFLSTTPIVDGYRPNKDGVMEVGRKFYSNAPCMRRFVAGNDDFAIKIFYDGLPILPVAEYTVIFMHRDPVEITESLKRFAEYTTTCGKKLTEPNGYYPFDIYDEYDPEDVQHCLDIAKQRQDCKVIEVQFRDLIRDTVGTLNRIRDNGVPIKVDTAAKVIDPDWYRCVA